MAKAAAAASFAWVRTVRLNDDHLGISVVFMSAFTVVALVKQRSVIV